MKLHPLSLLLLALATGPHAAQAQAATLTSRLSAVYGNFLVGYATVGDSGSFSETLRTLESSYERMASDEGGVDSFFRDLPVSGLGGFAAQQQYDFGAELISVLGAVSSHVSSPYAYVSLGAAGTSTLALEFTAPVSTSFEISGEVLSSVGPGIGGVASEALAVVQLTGTGVGWLWRSDLGPGSFAASGTLFAGRTYRLYANATSRANGDASYRVALNMSPVPEPAAWLLLALGLPALLWRRQLTQGETA